MFAKINVSLSAKKKSRSPRAVFYSQLMKNLAGAPGDDLGEAFTNNESEKFRSLMTELCDAMERAEHGAS